MALMPRLCASPSCSNSASECSKVIPENACRDTVDGFVGQQLNRPECVLAHCSGLLIVPNWSRNGGISLITPDQQTHTILAEHPTPLRPNGIALESGGNILLAHMGDTSGGIFSISADGHVEERVSQVNGEPMPPTNFVVKDSQDRLWITVSTRKTPRADDYRSDAGSGYIAVAQPGASEATIVADNLGYTNECVIDENSGCVYVNETFGRRLTCFDFSGNALPRLKKRRTLYEFGTGTYPDGLALDIDGGLWVTSIISNRILRVERNGHCQTIFEDSDESHLLWTEQAYARNALGREHLDNAKSRYVKNLSNAAFGGSQGNRLFLGNLLGDTLPFIDVETKGVRMLHWEVPLGALARFLQGAEADDC